jgi:O-antigen ligase
MESGNPVDRTILTIFLIVAMVVLAKRELDWTEIIRENKWAFILLGYMLISILWSPFPYISFKRWTRELIAIVMTFMVFSERDPKRAIITMLRRVSYILIPFSLLVIKYFPEYGVNYGRFSGDKMWIGVALQKNGLTRLCIIVMVFLCWTFLRRKQGANTAVTKYQTILEISLFFMALFLLMGPNRTLTYSATSILSLFAGALTFGVIYWMRNRGIKFLAFPLKAIVVLIIIYGTITPFLGRLSIIDVSSIVSREKTLTGRDTTWALLVPLALKRPVMGHGFGGFWTTEMRLSTDAHAHNGYLEVLLNTGFVGLLLAALFLLSSSQKAKLMLAHDFEWGTLFVCYLIMLLSNNIAEVSLDSLASSFTALILIFSVSSMKITAQKQGP